MNVYYQILGEDAKRKGSSEYSQRGLHCTWSLSPEASEAATRGVIAEAKKLHTTKLKANIEVFTPRAPCMHSRSAGLLADLVVTTVCDAHRHKTRRALVMIYVLSTN